MVQSKKNLTQLEEIVLAEIIGKTKEFIIAHPEIKLSAAQKQRFALARKKLGKGLPLAYVLGYKWFFGNKFAVNKSVLIPRPETEMLVELAIETARKTRPQIIVDVGTGSGAIIISLAKNLAAEKKQKTGFPKFLATDISKKALQIAKQNAKNLKTKIEFKKGNLVQPILKQLQDKGVMISANLPYLSAKELIQPTIKHEPKLALYGGRKADQKIEALIQQLAHINFSSATLILEINYNQAKTIKKLVEKYLEDYKQINVYKDLAGWDRIVKIIL